MTTKPVRRPPATTDQPDIKAWALDLQLMLVRLGKAVHLDDCESVLEDTIRRYRSRGSTPKAVILGEACYIAESL
jgi:hypothetical protein